MYRSYVVTSLLCVNKCAKDSGENFSLIEADHRQAFHRMLLS
jgi:hypothetical protein